MSFADGNEDGRQTNRLSDDLTKILIFSRYFLEKRVSQNQGFSKKCFLDNVPIPYARGSRASGKSIHQ